VMSTTKPVNSSMCPQPSTHTTLASSCCVAFPAPAPLTRLGSV
jgi:hypothetical protein